MWLYVPSHSVPAAADSNGALTLQQAARLERSVGWNGKPSLSRTWYSRWKRAVWLRRLSGVTFDPSTLDAGVDAWISSLRDSPASRGASPASKLGQTIRATCGPTAYESLSRLHRNSCSWKTSSLNLFTEQHRTCEQWATAAREAASRRARLVLLTGGSGGSCWPTPNVPNGGRTTDHATRDGATLYNERGKKVQEGLESAAKLWPTPTVKGDHNRKGASAQSGDGLSTSAKMWSTPNSRDHKGQPGKGCTDRGGRGASLPRDVEAWTGDQSAMCSHQVQATSMDGESSSAKTTASPRLSPRFVSWLMGWPPTAPDGFPCSETEWSRWRQRMRSALSRLLSAYDV